MSDHNAGEDGRSLVSHRTMEIVIALLLIVAAAIAITDSIRLGFGWTSDGPAPGFFPFWIGTLLAGSSIINLIKAIPDPEGAESFVSWPAFGRVMAVVIPTLLYIAAIGGVSLGRFQVPGIGIYAASALFIALFMTIIGRQNIFKAVVVGAGVTLALFLMFERWFLVPLPKGPIEAMLGFG
jgi:hypothetical protein